MKNYIFFLHSTPAIYFVSRLPLDVVIFQNYLFCFFPPVPPFASSSLPCEIDRHSHLSSVSNLPLFSVGNLSLSPFPFPLSLSLFHSLSTSPRENQGRTEEGAASCHWQWQSTTLAVIDNGGGRSTSVGRDVAPLSASLPPLLDVSPYTSVSTATTINDRESCWLLPSMATSRTFFPQALVLHHCHCLLLSW